MCGRFVLAADPEDVRALFDVQPDAPFPPRYNIAPTQPIAIVRVVHGRREFALVRWGLVPAWVEDPSAFALLINARAEGIAERPAFRAAMRYRRCLVPASGFYEWRRGMAGRPVRGTRQPYWVPPAGGGTLAFAGLWETWSDRDGGEIDTAAIVTTSANAEVRALHERMPVVIAPEDYATWLTGDLDEALALLRPAPDGYFAPVPVSTRVNGAEAEGADLLAPITFIRTDLFDV